MRSVLFVLREWIADVVPIVVFVFALAFLLWQLLVGAEAKFPEDDDVFLPSEYWEQPEQRWAND